MNSSLRTRLVVSTGLAVATTMIAAGFAIYGLVRQSLVAEVDAALAARARTLAALVEQDGDEVDLEDVELVVRGEPGIHVEVRRPGGEAVFRSDGWPEIEAAGGDPAWVAFPDGVAGRAVAHGFAARREGRRHRGQPGDRLELIVARPTPELESALTSLLGALVGVGMVTLLASCGVLALVVRRSLRPLDAVAARIATIGPDQLATRIEVAGAPAELREAVARINELLARLEGAFSRERAFSSDVAHELRTPLAGLRTMLEVTGSKPRSAEEYQAALQEALAIGAGLQRMVERLLQLARLESGQAVARTEPVALAEVVLESWRGCAALADARGLPVEWDLDAELTVAADPALLDLVVRNLLENAASHGRASIRVSARPVDATCVALVVENGGSDLTQAEADQAVQRFWRKEAARSQDGHCGLGLALVDQAVRALGGTLRLTSEVGGTFAARVELPRGAPQLEAVAAT